MSTLIVNELEIGFKTIENQDYISLTDMAKAKGSQSASDDIIKNWLRNRDTIEYLGTWETLFNPNFKPVEFDAFKKVAGLNSFVLTPKQWIEKTNAIGIISKSGRYGGTYAHKDLAFHFGMWISPVFQLYLIREYQHLKISEKKNEEWVIKRVLSKANYRIHTDAIAENLIPKTLHSSKISQIYASEADVLNQALFGLTAAEWKSKNLNHKGNMRDEATVEQLVVLCNLESLNAQWILEKMPQKERLIKLNQVAIYQMKSLLGTKNSLEDRIEKRW